MGRKRRIDTSGAPNFRDVGGYAAADGRTVKWGMVFRSDDLYDLSDADLDLLAGMNIRLVVDFRDEAEVANSPDRLPATARESVNIPIEAGKLMAGFGDGRLTRNKTMDIMVSVYRALALDFQPSYRRFFSLLADPGNVPLLFHCTAGKDRTGFAAAMFLSALGVDRATIMEDYLFSSECLKDKYVAGVDYDEVMAPLFRVEPEFLEAAFDVIDNQYNGMEPYLRERLGVDIEYFRETFTE